MQDSKSKLEELQKKYNESIHQKYFPPELSKQKEEIKQKNTDIETLTKQNYSLQSEIAGLKKSLNELEVYKKAA